MEFETVLARRPAFHVDDAGNPVSWQLSDEALRFIAGAIADGSVTLETGEGVSTVLFALTGCDHTCISPNPSAHQRIRDYCDRHQVSTSRVTFHTEPSELVLPRLDPTPLDLVLIDGGHGFPTPFIDWYYSARRLKVGGLVIIDDLFLWPPRMLQEFLASEPEWRLVRDLSGRAAVFEKTMPTPDSKEWTQQPFVVQARADYDQGRALLNAVRLARGGHFLTLARKAAWRLRHPVTAMTVEEPAQQSDL